MIKSITKYEYDLLHRSKPILGSRMKSLIRHPVVSIVEGKRIVSYKYLMEIQ